MIRAPIKLGRNEICPHGVKAKRCRPCSETPLQRVVREARETGTPTDLMVVHYPNEAAKQAAHGRRDRQLARAEVVEG